MAAGVVRQPRWAARWIAPVVLSLLAAGAWLALQPYTDSVRVQGMLARPEGEVVLRSPVGGVVTEIRARAGALVAQGDRLLVVDDARYSAISDETANEAVLLAAALTTQEEQLQLQLAQLETLEQLDRRRMETEQDSLERDLALLRTELELATRLLSLARGERIDAEGLAEEGHLSRVDLGALQRREAQAQAACLTLQRTISSQTHELAAVAQQRERSVLESAASGARLRSELAALARERALLPGRRQAVVAPISGIVQAVRVASGASVDRQQALLTIIDGHAPLVAELPVPSRSVTSIYPGQRVQLRYAGFPHQRYGSFAGTVLDVTNAPTAVVSMSPGMSGDGASTAFAAPLYRVRVVPDSPSPLIGGRHRDLPVGMQVEVDLLGDSRPLWMWLLEPILALRGRLV